MVYLLKLSCGHKAVTEVALVNQYHNDTHMILCPSCRHTHDHYGRIPTAWNEVVSYRELVHGIIDHMLPMFQRDARILPRDVMRLQPNVPSRRNRPFPYVKR